MGLTRRAIDIYERELYTPEVELREKYTAAVADRVIRLRELYNKWLSDPTVKDRQLRDHAVQKYGIGQSTAYNDLALVHQLIPMLGAKTKEYHRARANEMVMETYNMAKSRKDTRTMAQCIAAYGKNNGLDKPDDATPQWEEVPTQAFCATLDVRVLGIKPIPDVYNYISNLTKELLNDHTDIIDVEYEEPDLEEQYLFAPKNEGQSDEDS